MKSLKLAAAVLFMTLTLSVPAFAGQWMSDSSGWWYQNADGSYLKSGWYWIDGCCYYFNSNGYILTDTTAPDGSTVNSDGAWTSNGAVVTRPSEVTLSSLSVKVPNGYYATFDGDDSLELDQTNPTGSGSVLILTSHDDSAQAIQAAYGVEGLRQAVNQSADSLIQNIDGSVSTCLGRETKQFPTGTWFFNLYRLTADGETIDLFMYINYSGDEVRLVTIMGDNREFTPDQFINDYIR